MVATEQIINKTLPLFIVAGNTGVAAQWVKLFPLLAVVANVSCLSLRMMVV